MLLFPDTVTPGIVPPFLEANETGWLGRVFKVQNKRVGAKHLGDTSSVKPKVLCPNADARKKSYRYANALPEFENT